MVMLRRVRNSLDRESQQSSRLNSASIKPPRHHSCMSSLGCLASSPSSFADRTGISIPFCPPAIQKDLH